MGGNAFPWREDYEGIVVITVAGPGNYDSSFSADTGMAECLLIARRKRPKEDSDEPDSAKGEVPAVESERVARAVFVILNQQVPSATAGELLAAEIRRLIEGDQVRKLEDTENITQPRLGEDVLGTIVDASIPVTGPWPLAGISDGDLAQTAYHLEHGRLLNPRKPGEPGNEVPVSRIGNFAEQGLVDRDINGTNSDGTPRGPFTIDPLSVSSAPRFPMLWAHDAKRERKLVVEPDSERKLRDGAAKVTRDDLDAKAADAWETATRAHYSRDLRFNSQSLIVAMTERPCIGGRTWPSVDRDHEYACALWCNSTLGLLMHWWVSNKTQSGRGTTTVTGITDIPTLDVTKLAPQKIVDAKKAFEAVRDLRFLPFDQIDEDPARAELDRRLLVDVLGLPESLCDKDGPIDLLRRKLAKEPQIHGGKKSRVVFFEPDGEGTQVRKDRGKAGSKTNKS